MNQAATLAIEEASVADPTSVAGTQHWETLEVQPLFDDNASSVMTEVRRNKEM